MGLFSWLFGAGPRVPVADRIWLTDAALLRAVVRDAGGHHRGGRTVLLLAHFPATLVAVRAALAAGHLADTPFPRNTTPPQLLRAADTARPPLLFTGLVRDLRPDPYPAPADAPGDPVPVIVAERHFLRRYDDTVVGFADGLGGRGRVAFHTSVDAPLVKLFVGDRIREMLRRLGVAEDEAIESAMVARRVMSAQNHIAARVGDPDREADSAEEWTRANLGGG